MRTDALSKITSGPARLAEARSARFVAWLSLGDAEPTDEELWASGTTDFISLETRAYQRPIPPSRMRALRDNNRALEPNLFSRAMVAGVLRWLERSDDSGEFQDFFYTGGRAWKSQQPDSWCLRFRNAAERPGFRAGLDPTLVLEAIPAVASIEAQKTLQLDGHSVEFVEGRADLRVVADRLQDYLKVPGMRQRAQGWYDSAPIRLWIDDTALIRRISYAPLPPPDPRSPQRAWTTLHLSDFGTPIDRPAFFGTSCSQANPVRPAPGK